MLFIMAANLAMCLIYWYFAWKGIAPFGLADFGGLVLAFVASNLNEKMNYPEVLFHLFLNLLIVLAVSYSYMPNGVSIFKFPVAVTAGLASGALFSFLLAFMFTLSHKSQDSLLLPWTLVPTTALISLPLISHLFF